MTDQLETRLIDVGRKVAYPSTPEFDLTREPLPRRSMRPFLVAAAVVALVLVVLALPGPRAAIADFFGIGAVQFEITDEIEPSDATGFLPGKEVSLDEAIEAVDFALVSLDQTPDIVLLDDSVPGGMVTLGYGAVGSGYRVLITQLHARSDDPSLSKLLSDPRVVVSVDVGGDRGFWIEGEHTVVLLDQDDNPIVDTARLAASTLLAVSDDLTVRIEGDLTLEEAIEVAMALD